MAIREAINRNPRTSILTAVGIILVAGALALFYSWQRSGSDSHAALVFFTVDDGKTWFADDAAKLAPFEHRGKTAYRCYVWTCDGGKMKFVSHLERYTPEARRRLEEQRNAAPGSLPPPPPGMMMDMMATEEVKRPNTGDTGWVNKRDPRAAAIMEPKCPSGGSGTPQRVLPD